MSEQYFSDISIGDLIFVVGIGDCTVSAILQGEHDYPIISRSKSGDCPRRLNYSGVHVGEILQSAFWSDPGIVAPPKPKRMKKVKVEVRPYQLGDNDYHLAVPTSRWCFCGPAQTIEVEVEDVESYRPEGGKDK